jgi:pimeloyl-ACP methyl ester carboxylesterase
MRLENLKLKTQTPRGHPKLKTESLDWQADLDQFRATHALQRRQIDGHDWEYISCGDGAEAVLVLPGGLAVAETAFRYIQRFEPRYQVLAPTYPETIATMAQLVDGLAQLVRAERIAHVYLIGGSYSGLVAQCLLRHAPDLVAKLVLSDTGVPRRSRARLYARTYLPLVRYLPLRVLRWLFCCGVAPVLLGLPAQRAFWWRYFRQRIATMSRAAYLSHLAIWLDFDRNYRFSTRDLAHWSGTMLIIDAEHDSLFGQAERRILRTLYEDAQVYTFAGSTHGASLARMDEYIDVIEGFLQ